MPKRKQINSLQEAFDYLNRLGFAGNGTIAARQHNLSLAANLLLKAGGYTSWEEPVSFGVRYHPYDEPGVGRFPWLSRFTVWERDGGKVGLYMGANHE